MDAFATDLRLALRRLRRHPGSALVVVATLAVAIGANVALFAVVDAVLLQPLPMADADRLVAVYEIEGDRAGNTLGFATYADWRDRAKTTSLAVASQWRPVMRPPTGDPQPLVGQRVTAGYFSVLGLAPILGRDFTAEEDRPGAPRVAILGDRLWRRLGADPGWVGKTIDLAGTPYEVIGIVSARDGGLAVDPSDPKPEIWSPLRYEASQPWACRTCRHLQAVGRLGPGVSLDAATSEMSALVAAMAAEHPDEYFRPASRLQPIAARLAGPVRPALVALGVAVALVLLMASINVASVVLSDAERRSGELALRAALGAGRLRLGGQWAIEVGVYAVCGGLLGLGLAWIALDAIARHAPAGAPRLDEVGLGGRGVLATAAVTLLAAVLSGLLPVFRAAAASRRDGFQAVRATARGARGGLVVVDTALAAALLLASGLLLRSVAGLLGLELGFEASRLTATTLIVAGPAYFADDGDARTFAFYREVVARAAASPGVVAVAATSQLPLGTDTDGYGVEVESHPRDNPELAPDADRFAVTAGYRAAMGIPLVAGRDLSAEDRRDAAPVVLVNATFAEREWPGESPLGQRVRLGGSEQPWRTIVGVVGDVRHRGLDQAQSNQVYVPSEQWPWADTQMSLMVRSSTLADAAAAARSAVRAVDPTQAIGATVAMDEVVRRTVSSRGVLSAALAGFAVVALVLAGVGIFGVVSQSVARRQREIGVRAALGAGPRTLERWVLGQAVRPATAGLLVGLATAPGIARLLEGQLWGVQALDPPTVGAATAILLLLAVGAAWLPARRALATDPATVLRSE